ncbi:50S ribosomal protein L24 [Pikeienuella sp. HZG-20]|uniref:50S ribosomal protein L24 n=1 Tax=Paludibacillus litoralis TaxID=3133267 RepID=UPI0030EF2CD8
MAAKLKKGDKVIVLAGRDKGKEGEIEKVLPKLGRAVVSGVNVAIRHTKPSQGEQGGRVPKSAPIDLSNLALVDPKDGGATRVGFKIVDGRKVRFAKKSGEVIDA